MPYRSPAKSAVCQHDFEGRVFHYTYLSECVWQCRRCGAWQEYIGLVSFLLWEIFGYIRKHQRRLQ